MSEETMRKWVWVGLVLLGFSSAVNIGTSLLYVIDLGFVLLIAYYIKEYS